jgi:hypothetical protein
MGRKIMPKLNQKGSVLIFLTLAFALLGTFIGFAVDFGRAYLEKARISRLVDGAALAAAKVLKGQSAYEAVATRAACDSMVMNGAPVAMTGPGSCAATTGAPFTVTLEFFDVPVPGGPAMKQVAVTGTEPMPTTFLRFLGWMVPGDFSTLNVAATAQAAPERPIDLMMVLDRSGSMGETDGTGHTKIAALKCALTGLGCAGDGFLGENFTPQDRIGMTSFGKRGCGTAGGAEFTGNICTPNSPLGTPIATIASAIDALPLSGTTNTMEGLRTGKTEIATAFADPTRSVTRKVVLLVTDGQPTALRLNSIAACGKNPLTGASLGGPAWTNANGCYFVKRGNSTSFSVSDGLTRMRLDNTCEEEFAFPGPASTAGCGTTVSGSGSPNTLYLNQMHAARNAAREEARQIRELGGKNVIIFAIAIGPTTHADATARLDANSRCLLAAIANDKTMLEDLSINPGTGSCNAINTTPDGDNHSDLSGGNKPIFDPSQQRGKVYTVDLNGDVQAQLQVIFNEIAALLKLRLVL